ncbi:MAG: S41 family peptidase [Candidatus Omnitrophica bacterium]|nr:S41 family peptidase [Candidatus Omnitrophota bacterium]
MRNRIIIISLTFVVLFASLSAALSGSERKKRDDLYRQVELFADTLAIIQSDYMEEVKPKDLIYGALKGMLSSLDAHSQFMDPDTYNELKVDTKGNFGGLGIEITIKDGLLTVITPIEGTPAWRAGLKPGDRIVKINNELTRDLTLTEAVKKMRGKPGEAANLTVLRESEKKVLEFKIVRAIIKIKDIKEAKILEDGIGYIRLVEFRENTPADFNAALERLSKKGMNSLILDLRNNPGGLLESAVDITGEFIPKGKLVVYTRGRKNDQDVQFVAHTLHPMLNIPLVILINEGSASGSEIVAGALQDYKRATIVGATSFGKGSVQTVIPLSDGSALRLTTSKYFTPLGKVIHNKGVVPDVIISPEKEADKNQEILEEAGLKDKPLTDKKPLDYKSDLQISSALEILKTGKIDNKAGSK